MSCSRFLPQSPCPSHPRLLFIQREESIAALHAATEPARFSLRFFQVEDGLLTANAENFRHLLAAPDYVFVRFFTSWCAQCVSTFAEYWKELARTVVC